ncbi:IS66 family transposase [Haloferula chungangensis]|uniref:IS66 family transposase n=1 Tax=Haloferula chungangensis TaxID=1048331 RepID=A0ABW2LDP2_9BACT
MTEEQAAQLIEQNKKLLDKVASLEAELQQQKDLVAALLKRLYGTKSEQLSHDQLLMTFLESEAKKPAAADPLDQGPAAETQAKAPRAKRTSKLAESLKGLPTRERIIVSPEVLDDPDAYRLIGEEVSERLHVSPAAFTREVIRRQTHVLRNDPDAVPITPPLEPCLLPGSVLTPSLGAYLLTEKFCYHQPFYRLEWRLRATHGIELRRDLMCSWHDHLADLLRPLYELIAGKIRHSDHIQIDETPIRCLQPGTGKTSQGYLWAYHHPEHGILFDWHKSRANTCLDHILIGKDRNVSFEGHLQSDGLRGYRTFIERHPELAITPVSCLAHIRRKFTEASGDHPRITAWILLQIGKIYHIEAELKRRRAGPDLRKRARRLLLRRIHQHLAKLLDHLQTRRRILPKSNLGKALNYARAQWPHLEPCFEDGRLEFDNNHTEGAIRPTKVGMKNWIFVGGEHTGWRSAVVYTFVEQVRRHGHDPHAYFEWAFGKLMHAPGPDEMPALLPSVWIESQQPDQSPSVARVA